MIHYNLDIKIVILNNFGYGIIKQFQDSYFQSRYEATGRGYSQPSFKRIAKAYGIDYVPISSIDEITVENLSASGIRILDIFLDPNTLIEPKLEMGNPINNQFPYLPINEIVEGNHFIE
jgi:acetolactate synthase-1/2/3 large subunit